MEEVEAGGEVVIARGKRPVVRLVPHAEKKIQLRPTVGKTTSKPVKVVEKREVEGEVGDSVVYF